MGLNLEASFKFVGKAGIKYDFSNTRTRELVKNLDYSFEIKTKENTSHKYSGDKNVSLFRWVLDQPTDEFGRPGISTKTQIYLQLEFGKQPMCPVSYCKDSEC